MQHAATQQMRKVTRQVSRLEPAFSVFHKYWKPVLMLLRFEGVKEPTHFEENMMHESQSASVEVGKLSIVKRTKLRSALLCDLSSRIHAGPL